MTPDRDDSILDACLDEVLGGRTPPDLTGRILQAWAARHPAMLSTSTEGLPEPPPVLMGAGRVLDAPPTNGRPIIELAVTASGGHRPASKSTATWLPLLATVAACMAGIAVTIGVGSLLINRPVNVANRPQSKGPVDKKQIVAVPSTSQPQPTDRPLPSAPALADATDSHLAHQPSSAVPSSPPLAPSDTNQLAASPSLPSPTKRYLKPSPDAEIVSFVNAEFGRTWSEANVKPSPVVSDSEWCDRVFTRLFGRAAPKDELAAFAGDKATDKAKGADKRSRLVSRLLNDESYVQEYARYWSVVWTNVLVGRLGGGPGSLASREELELYLRGALVTNKPYDELVSELLTATGSTRPGADDYNPAVNFLLDGFDREAVLTASRVCRVFLGQRLQCAQCHSHLTQDWSQEQFWSLNAFFRQMKAERGEGLARLSNVDFVGQGRGGVFYETPEGLMKTALPRFIDGTEISPSGQLAHVDRRRELARLIVASDQLPKALVNRVWSQFFGYGFTRPVDDLGPNTSISQPQVLDRLAHEFAAHDYDLKSVIRWAVLSDPFTRSSKLTDVASRDMPEAGELALFSRYYSRPTKAQSVPNALTKAAQIRKASKNQADVVSARRDWLMQASRGPVTDSGQKLMDLSGPIIPKAFAGPQGELAGKIAASQMPFDKKVEHFFLSALSRQPSGGERRLAATMLQNAKGDQTTALEDVWWAILNSDEAMLAQ